MSFQQRDLNEASEDKGGFFFQTESECDWGAQGDVEHHKLILQKADALASENCLKEAVNCFSMAMRYGPVRPEQLSTLVDCVLRNFNRKVAGHSGHDYAGSDMFDCLSCHSFIGEPVTLVCGHSYCKRCLRLWHLSKCKVCSESIRETPGNLKLNVILCGLLEKWFPEDLKRYKSICDIEDLTRRQCFREAVTLATDVIQCDPVTAKLARLCRAEAYTALKEYHLALEDAELSLSSSRSAEGFFRKAMVLHEMGQVDESLQVLLQCLALDEDLTCARRQVEMILFDLLSMAGENLKIGLRETTQSTSPHLRSKTLVTDDQTQNQPRRQTPHPSQQQLRVNAASAHHKPDSKEKSARTESLERSGLNRAHSLRTHSSNCGEEGLKRVSSAPQLGDQEKGGMLKRKLSASDSGPCIVWSGSSKQKKQGVASASNHHASTAKPCRVIPQDMIDSVDLECSLCMRLFYEPVTTPCGHTFCKNCLERCLDHTPQCPLCKESLRDYLAYRKYMVTSVLDELIKKHFCNDYAERSKAHLEEASELSDLTKNMPIFVCTMAYPTVPCPLHVFEPRYRLMIRRCMDTGTRQFGMCINDPQKGFADYGCMLIIRSVHFLPDGRSVVDTIGGKRFRVLSRGMKDGYSIADIEHLEDTRVEEGEELVRLQELHDEVYEQACTWFQNLKIRFHNQILQHFGPMPEREADIQATPNGPACCWWLLAVLPIDPRYQLSVLSLTTLRERLVKIQQILAYLQSIPSN